MKFKQSALAHRLLDGLEGLEIGGSAHNSFGLKTRNVDYCGDITVFKQEEIKICGEYLPVDIVSPGDKLPLDDSSVDFVINSHVIEHFPDPIKALKEWHRVVRPGGYIYVIAPHKDRTFDRDRPRTTLAELIERHTTGVCPDPDAAHCSVWITEDLVELIQWLGWPVVAVQDTDDKVGNGFAVVIGVEKKGSETQASAASSTQAPAVHAKPHLSMTFVMGPTARIRTGGAACILEYARRFKARGNEVSLTTWPKFLWLEEEPFPGFDSDIPVHYDSTARRESLPYHFLNKTPRDYLAEMRFFLAYMHLVTPAIPQADLIIAANWEGIIPAWQSGKGKPVHFPQHYDEVFFAQDSQPSAGLQGNPLIKMLCRNTFQMPVYRIANSTWLAGEFRRRFGETVPVVQHGIDTTKFHLRPKLSDQDGVIRVVTYCRPEKWKGFQDAVPAMQELMRLYPNKIAWHVYGFAHPVFGPDNELAPYKFHGALGHEELSRLYSESDIVLCPSWYESFPLPPIEAMACGTSVITTPYGTEDYAIDGHTAIVVRPRVVSDFIIALDGLVRLPELRQRLARNGRAIAESLTWDGAVAAREQLLWRIQRNEMPTGGLQGFDTGIVDGYGTPFDRLSSEVQAKEGELLQGVDNKHYLVESGRLRRVVNPSAIGLQSAPTRPLDLLSLLQSEHGPDITSTANYYGLRA
jgi:glycosyltransferase involved in cell wall biosynthesis